MTNVRHFSIVYEDDRYLCCKSRETFSSITDLVEYHKEHGFTRNDGTVSDLRLTHPIIILSNDGNREEESTIGKDQRNRGRVCPGPSALEDIRDGSSQLQIPCKAFSRRNPEDSPRAKEFSKGCTRVDNSVPKDRVTRAQHTTSPIYKNCVVKSNPDVTPALFEVASELPANFPTKNENFSKHLPREDSPQGNRKNSPEHTMYSKELMHGHSAGGHPLSKGRMKRANNTSTDYQNWSPKSNLDKISESFEATADAIPNRPPLPERKPLSPQPMNEDLSQFFPPMNSDVNSHVNSPPLPERKQHLIPPQPVNDDMSPVFPPMNLDVNSHVNPPPLPERKRHVITPQPMNDDLAPLFPPMNSHLARSFHPDLTDDMYSSLTSCPGPLTAQIRDPEHNIQRNPSQNDVIYSEARNIDESRLPSLIARLHVEEASTNISIQYSSFCACGLNYEESKLPWGWSFHMCVSGINKGKIFYQDKSGNTEWHLPEELQSRLSECQKAMLRKYGARGFREKDDTM